MIRNRSLRFAVLVAAAVCAGGCLSSATSGVRIENGIVSTRNPAFASHFRLTREASVETPEGFLRVQIRVENLERGDRALQYHFIWLDEHGMTLTSARSMWTALTLHGREVKELEAVCPVPGAKDIRVDLRPL